MKPPEGTPDDLSLSPRSQSDTEHLFKRVKRDGKAAFEDFDRKMRQFLTASLQYEKLPAAHEIEDVVQITLYEALGAIESWNPRAGISPKAWIRAILRHTLSDLHRRAYTKGRDVRRTTSLGADEAAAEQIPDSGAEHASAIARTNERNQALHNALGKMPSKYLEILRLREEEDWDYAALAVRYAISEVAARARVYRAREERKRIVGAIPDLGFPKGSDGPDSESVFLSDF